LPPTVTSESVSPLSSATWPSASVGIVIIS
jgi:hypothetical protein